MMPSPCIDICQLNNNGICIGCGRTKQEIADWPYATDKERVAIYDKSAVRLKTIFNEEHRNA